MAKKEIVKSNPYLVVQDNEFINFRHTLSVQEARVFLTMIAKVERDDEDFKEYEIDVQKFIQDTGLKKKNIYSELKKVSEQLTSKKFRKEENGSFLITNYVSSAEYIEGEGVVKLSFDPKLKPYLLQLKSKFTQYDIRNIIALRSIFSVLLYQLLKQFESIGERTFDLIDLKYKLNVDDKYKNYAHFRVYVLEIAEKEIKENCDIYFTFEEIKKGRKVQSIKFRIYSQKPPRERIKAIEQPKPKPEEEPSHISHKIKDVDFIEVKQEPKQTITPSQPSRAMIQEEGEKAKFTTEVIAEILEHYDNNHVRAWEVLKEWNKMDTSNIKRPKAYIFNSTGLGVGLWNEQQAKQQKNEQKKLEQWIETVNTEYKNRKHAYFIDRYNRADEAEKIAIFEIIKEDTSFQAMGKNFYINAETDKLNQSGILKAGELLAENKGAGKKKRQERFRNDVFEKYQIQINFDENDMVIL